MKHLHRSLPEPLRGLDIPSFTHYSIVVRLPEIARRMINENHFSPEIVERVQTLIDEIPYARIRPLNMPGAPDAAQWASYVQHFLDQNWLEVPWFFAEEYFYQRILEATGYYHEGEWLSVDPYALQKRLGLETTAVEIQTLAGRLEQALLEIRAGAHDRTALSQMLLIDLWGNQNDLSLWPATEPDGPGPGEEEDLPVALREAQDHILDNQLDEVTGYLTGLPASTSRIDILLDNAGFELVCDLALADCLLTGWQAASVVLHLKIQPVFVSDAMEQDINQTLEFLSSQRSTGAQALADRLKHNLMAGRLILRPDPFWTSPLPMWEAPDALINELRASRLLISKGDANYRRLLGDRHWPTATPFRQVVNYLPTAVLALRTLKSEIATGILPERIPHHDPEWMSNGRWGLVQFAPAPSSGDETRV